MAVKSLSLIFASLCQECPITQKVWKAHALLLISSLLTCIKVGGRASREVRVDIFNACEVMGLNQQIAPQGAISPDMCH